MRSLWSRVMLALALIVTGLVACESGLPTSSEPDLARPASPEPLIDPLPETGEEPVTLVRVRHGETLTPDDARLTVIDRSLPFPAVIANEPITRTVFAPVLHFSRYAICVD